MDSQTRAVAMDGCPMSNGSEPLFSLADPKVLFDRSPHYRFLRENCPVYHDKSLDLHVVSRYEDVTKVLLDWESFSLELGYHKHWGQGHLDELKAILERDGGGYFPDVITVDPPRHKRIRRLLDNAFSTHRLKLLEPALAARVEALVEGLADRGEADGLADIATPMTIGFMAGQLGLTDIDPAQIKIWSDAYQAQYGRLQSREDMIVNAQRICELQQFVFDLVAKRRADPGEDMVSDLIRAELDDEENPKLSHGEIVALTRTLLIGGNDSISTALTNLLLLIATDADIARQFHEAAEDERHMVRFVEEAIRVIAPVRALTRIATRDVELGGTVIPEGGQVLILYGSGNEDEAAFACPNRFDSDRRNLAQHLSFGVGIHRCVGLALVRMEVRLAMQAIARHLADIRLAIPADQVRYVPNMTMVMMEALPLTFSRRG